MFVVSFSSSLVKRIVIPIVIAFISIAVILSCISSGKNEDPLQANAANISNSSDVLNYISSLGWEVCEEPDEIKEIVIPYEFNDVYKSYNEIQKNQGFDLTDYAGERVKLWTYTVTNYPGYEGKDCIKINVLVYENCVIGGDVCSVEIDGFMHGFSGG